MTLMSNPIVVPSLHVIVRLETVIVLQPGPISYEKDTASDGGVVAASSTATAQARTRNACVEISRVCMLSPPSEIVHGYPRLADGTRSAKRTGPIECSKSRSTLGARAATACSGPQLPYGG